MSDARADSPNSVPDGFRKHGEVNLDAADFAFTASLMPRDVERLPAGCVQRVHHGGDETHITLNPQPFRGVRFHINLRFRDDRLNLIELMALNEEVPEVMAAGGAWTRENEMARKRFHEAWATSALETPLEIKPWIDPDLPQPVMPANPGLDHPRYAAFAWGEIGSYLDEKGCAAMLIISYGN